MNKGRGVLCVRVFGGLGNQLFIYAFSRALAIKNDCDLIFDGKTGFLFDKYKRKLKINRNTSFFKPASLLVIVIFYLSKYLPSLFRKIFKSKICVESDFLTIYKFNDQDIFKYNYIFLQGYFQSYLYFDNYASIIKEEIQLNFTKSNLINSIAENIQNKNAVSIHVRRVQYSDLLTLDYYKLAISEIKQKVNNPEYFIFSDDIEWCKASFSNIGSFNFVLHDVSEEVADLWLMTQCKHHIIANSSYSWWGAWLSTFDKKVVVAPKQTQIGVRNNFYPKDWIEI
jgi:hypothetical protein